MVAGTWPRVANRIKSRKRAALNTGQRTIPSSGSMEGIEVWNAWAAVWGSRVVMAARNMERRDVVQARTSADRVWERHDDAEREAERSDVWRRARKAAESVKSMSERRGVPAA